MIEIQRTFNRALAFRDPFDPDLKIVNDFGADVFFGVHSSGSMWIRANMNG